MLPASLSSVTYARSGNTEPVSAFSAPSPRPTSIFASSVGLTSTKSTRPTLGKSLSKGRTNGPHVASFSNRETYSLKYSKYLPLHRQSRATSRTTSTTKDGPRSPQTGDRVSKNSRSNANPHMGKRRSTMNSRDAAYDDEQLRRAIEASKEDIAHDLSESVIRRTKRGRSDSERFAVLKSWYKPHADCFEVTTPR